MELEIWRYNGGSDATLGLFMLARELTWELQCFTVEDEHRETKVYGETRIPAGRYRVELRNEGTMDARYRDRYGAEHRGMLWVRDVPGFTWIYIHTGNSADDTAGCIVVGQAADEVSRRVSSSRAAYENLYRKVAGAIIRGEPVWLTVRDCDRLDRRHPPEVE